MTSIHFSPERGLVWGELPGFWSPGASHALLNSEGSFIWSFHPIRWPLPGFLAPLNCLILMMIIFGRASKVLNVYIGRIALSKCSKNIFNGVNLLRYYRLFGDTSNRIYFLRFQGIWLVSPHHAGGWARSAVPQYIEPWTPVKLLER